MTWIVNIDVQMKKHEMAWQRVKDASSFTVHHLDLNIKRLVATVSIFQGRFFQNKTRSLENDSFFEPQIEITTQKDIHFCNKVFVYPCYFATTLLLTLEKK